MQHRGAKAHAAEALQNRFVVRDAPSRRLGWFWAMLLQRCPRCRTGRIFRGQFAMNDPCPLCGLIFQREEGYFLGSMYTSYILSCGLLTISYCLAVVLLPGWNSILLAAVALLPYLPLLPAVFRYSRVLWIYFDRAVCPGDVSAGAYEKSRLQRASREDGSNGIALDRDRVGAN